jgi:dihydroneopterin aldolase
MRKRVKVFIDEMKLHVHCGVYKDERGIGVDAKLSVEVESDEFVDYEKLYQVIKKVSKGEFEYIETLLETIAKEIFKIWKVKVLKLRLYKMSLPFENTMKSAGVEIVWEGQDNG